MGERPGRYDGTGAHAIATRGGRAILLHDFDRWVCAANGWDNGCISIEIDGVYPERVGGRTWDGSEGMTLTPEGASAALGLIAWIRSVVPSVRVIVAHRQSSELRLPDPGEDIWKKVALPSGLAMAPTTTLGTGKPLPDYWLR